jgi:hypothetical protein
VNTENTFSFAHRDRRGLYTPCALTRLASVLKHDKDARTPDTGMWRSGYRLGNRLIGGRVQTLRLA